MSFAELRFHINTLLGLYYEPLALVSVYLRHLSGVDLGSARTLYMFMVMQFIQAYCR